MSHEYFAVVIIPVINGLAEVMKRAGLPNKFVPLLAVVMGLAAGIFLRDMGEPIAPAIIEGLVMGLSAVGMYSGTRNVLNWSGNGGSGNDTGSI
ncbi:MAG: hypothetical protein ACM3UZ_10000 [Acidobacteriota bacterium]